VALRIVLLTLESTASAAAAARVLRETRQEVAGLLLSDPWRGAVRRTLGLLRRSGPRILPWLFVEFAAPRLFGRRGAGPLAAATRARGIAPIRCADINSAATRERLAALQPDLIVTCHFDQILTAETIALARLGGINLHPSLLPAHRGPMPCFWAAAEGQGRFGVTIHRLVPRIDAGPILAQRAVAIPAGATVATVARLLHEAGAELLIETIEAMANGERRARDVTPLPYCPFPDRAALAAAARRGVRLCDWADLRAARALGGTARG